MKHLDKIANVSIIVAVAVFLVVTVHREFFKPAAPMSPDRTGKALVGKTLAVPGLQFPRPHNVILLAVSTQCHFCKDSLPFYKELAAKAQGKADIVAVLPQQPPEAQAFFKQADVAVSQVISAGLGSEGVTGTPTLILIDATGKVEAVWVGKLDVQQQQEVLSRAAL
jgi:thiol-disulfide isomerase/thioredoxin